MLLLTFALGAVLILANTAIHGAAMVAGRGRIRPERRVDDGGIPVRVGRHYYASTGYNLVQTVAGFLPVAEGTLVIYTNRTSTDQLEGFGASAKRSRPQAHGR